MIHHSMPKFNALRRYPAFILLLFLLTGCFGGYGRDKAPAPTPAATPTPEATPMPTVTPSPSPAPAAATPAPQKAEAPAQPYDSLSNKTSGWGYRRNRGGRPEFTSAQVKLMQKYGAIFMGSAEEKNLYLTFDEGYENGYTPIILDVLKEHNVPAAFFVTGPYLRQQGELVKRMVNEGHIVGNHSVNHPSLPELKTIKEIEDEILGVEKMFFDLTGQQMKKYLRPPRGEYSERTLAITRDMGYTNVFWSFAYRDWETDNQKGADYAFDMVTGELHNGAVLLLHAVSKDNAEALPHIITYAKANGYTFRSLDDFR